MLMISLKAVRNLTARPWTVSMNKYRCGKSIDLWSVRQEGTLFAGRRIVQHRDYRVTVSMNEFVKNKASSDRGAKRVFVKYQGNL